MIITFPNNQFHYFEDTYQFCIFCIFSLLAVMMPMHMQQTKNDDIQAILSQNDSKTLIAENLLKQIGSTVKQEIEEDRSAVMAIQPQTNCDSTTNFNSQRPIKCEATSTSRRSPSDLKNEPVLKIENIYETNRKVVFNTEMNSKQLEEAVR